jgi:hypothetical protein
MIYKYVLKVKDVQHIEMPKGARILTGGVQGAQLVLWAVVNVAKATVRRTIRIVGTGHETGPSHAVYIATVQMHHVNGIGVWHLFDDGEKEI